MKIQTILIIFMIIALTGCQPNLIGGDRDEHGCLIGEGYSYDEDIGACTRGWGIDENKKEVIRNVLMVQSYSSFTIVSIEKIVDCEDCYDVTLQRNPIDEETKKEKYLEPYVIPYREGRIDYSYDNPISNFDECIAAGNPAMESYPRQCRDQISDKTFTEELRKICTEEQKTAEICTMDYNPVCGELVLNTGKTTYQTYSNACGACSSIKVVAYTPGECEDKQFVVCDGGAKIFDPKEYAQDNNGICVELCPEGFDTFMTQIGIKLCITHYGEIEIEQWEKCEKSTDSCKCVKAYETTDEKQINNAEYRCVPEKYAEKLLFRRGIDSLDEKGVKSVMIA